MTKAREIAELGQKLTVDASGNIDVAGSVTSDSLAVAGTDDVASITTNQSNYTEGLTIRNTANWGYGSSLSFEAVPTSGGSASEVGRLASTWNAAGYHGFEFYVLNNNTLLRHMKLEGDGDLSLYDDTGVNAKFFWDASGEVLGLGTNTPNTGAQLHLDGGTGEGSLRIEGDTNTKISAFASTTGANWLYFGDPDQYNSGFIRYDHSNDSLTHKAKDHMKFTLASTERVRITVDGDVGIGNSVPGARLNVRNLIDTNAADGTGVVKIQGGASNYGGYIGMDSSTMSIGTDNAIRGLSFVSGGSERARITPDGKFAIGTDSPTGKLSITGSNPNIRLDDDDTSSNAELTLDNTSLRIEVDDDNLVANSSIKFQIDGSTSAIITDTGRFGIGDTNPVSTLEISNEDQPNGTTLTITNSFSGGLWAVDDIIGTINFRTDDGSTSEPIRGQVQSITDNVLGTNWPYGTALTFSTAYNNTLSERVRINSSGNVGIGGPATTGQGRLHVYGATPYIDIEDTTSGSWDYDDTFSGIRFRTSDGDAGSVGQVHAFIKAKHTRSGTGHSNPDAGLVFATSTGTNPAPTERMRITEDGFIGINETAPQAPLHITRNDNSDLIMLECTDGDATEGPQMHLYRNSASPADGDDLGVIKFRGKNSNGSEINYVEIGAFISDVTAGTEDAIYRVLLTRDGTQVNAFEVSSTEVCVNENSNDIDFRVESNGNANMLKVDGGTNSVHIGSGSEIASTTTGLNVTSSGRACDIYRSTATATNNVINVYSNFGGTKTANAVIDVDGDMENTNNRYTGFSDQRFKQDIVDATSQWDDIKALQVRKYRFINLVEQLGDDAPVHLGVIAQELEASGMGGLVKTKPVDEDNPDAGDRKSVAYSVLYMKAVKALQEAMERIETLETQRADLETRLAALEGA